MSEWKAICRVDDIPMLGARRVARPAGMDVGDQKRVVTPRQALDDGASIIVIGRPITAAPDPAQAIRDIAADLSKEVIS